MKNVRNPEVVVLLRGVDDNLLSWAINIPLHNVHTEK